MSTYSLVVLLHLTHIFPFQHRSCSHQFQCLYIHVTWLTSLLPIRYLSYFQFFTLINSAAMNVFVKKKNARSFGFFPWEYLQRGITRSKSMNYFIARFVLPDCFLERSNLWVGRTLQVISSIPLFPLNAWIPLQFMMPPAMYKHYFYLPIVLPVLGFAILIYFC